MPNHWSKDRISAAGDLSGSFRFKVDFNNISFGFQSVSGIEISRTVDWIVEGGVNDHKCMVGKPQESTFELTCTRGLITRASSAITGVAKAAVARIPSNAVRKLAFFALNTVDPQELLEFGPALGTITVYSTTRRDKIIGLYSFLALGISKWSIGDLDATSGGVMVETFTIIHNGITRIPLSPPSGHYYWGEDTEVLDVKTGDKNKYKIYVEDVTPSEDKLEKERKNLKKEPTLELEKNRAIIDEMEKLNGKNKILADKIHEKLQALLEQMEEEYQSAEALRREWEESRKEGLKKAEFIRRAARVKAEKYLQESRRLTEEIIKSEKTNLKQIRNYSKQLAGTTQKASEIAKETADNLAVELSNFRKSQKEKNENFDKKIEEVELAKLAAIQAMELARAMAKASKEAAKELQAKKWDETIKKNQEELDEARYDFEEQREKGLEETKKVQGTRLAREEERKEEVKKIEEEREKFEKESKEEREKRLKEAEERYRELFEKAEKEKKEFEEKRKQAVEEAKKESKKMADEAEETAAEAENTADEVQAMLEIA